MEKTYTITQKNLDEVISTYDSNEQVMREMEETLMLGGEVEVRDRLIDLSSLDETYEAGYSAGIKYAIETLGLNVAM